MIDALLPFPPAPQDESQISADEEAGLLRLENNMLRLHMSEMQAFSPLEEVETLRAENSALRVVIAQKDSDANTNRLGCILASGLCVVLIFALTVLLITWGPK